MRTRLIYCYQLNALSVNAIDEHYSAKAGQRRARVATVPALQAGDYFSHHTQGLRFALHPGLPHDGLPALINGNHPFQTVSHRSVRQGLKAPNVTAWAGASPRAEAQVNTPILHPGL